MKRTFNLFVLVTLLTLFVGVVGVSADKGTPPPVSPSVPGGTLTGGPLSTGGPDAYGYTWTDTISGGVTYSWDEISGTGTALAVSDDSVSGAIPLPFTFSYYGANYSNIYVGSNGFVTFLAGQSQGCCDGLALPDAGSPNGIIAGYWADLFTTGGGTVYYQTLGVAPHRRFVVEWTGVPYFWEAGSATFEIKLFEGSNIIEVHYTGASTYTTRTASMGIENTTGTDGLNYAQGNIGVITGAIRYTPPPHVGLSTTSINFGYQEVGTTSAAQTVTITTSGSVALHVGTLSFTSDWILSNDTCSGATVVPAGTCTFDVAFHPLASGPLTGSINIPSNAATSPDTVSLSGNGYTALSSSFMSVGAYDGYVTESGENTNVGGTFSNPTNYLLVGDFVLDKQIRALLHFDTSSLPDTAVVTGLTLQLKRQANTGINPFTILGDLQVDITSPFFGAEVKPKPADFQAVPDAANVGFFNPVPAAGNWFSANLNAPAFPFLNLTGSTQFRLSFQLDDNDNLRSDAAMFFSGNFRLASYRPVLIVAYYIP